ncbi:hypothetical protein FHS18_002272 [Paenibacillus phyllosphaerae]|uniref:Uncharacterized protein n=1 Tax=Paenibacillus phyllosphaerae TaxID=274593 RepID=A0A7W5AWR3_9BACL|nr:hypothetical protein [Paenibacillus phyllosphaerae]MBB3110205.1 hypothetical protein [Paenibacillus phyllosphaerae]
MEQPPTITMEDMLNEAALFQSVYPDLIHEIERGERTRGKLNEFQLLQAIAHAKSGLGILNYERRQIINAIFDVFSVIYHTDGRPTAEVWASQNFGCTLQETRKADTTEVENRIHELTLLIQMKESELLQIYRELHMLRQYLDDH